MGTEEFWVPAVMAAVSAGAQQVNQSQANSRQQAAETQAIINQQNLRNQGNAQVNKMTQQIASANPTQLADKATGDYVAQLRKNAAGAESGTTGASQTFGQSTSALPSTVAGDSRYNTDVANSQKEVQDYGDTQAGEMGQIDAALRQRQNEGLGMQTLGANLDTLGAESWGDNFVDQIRAQAAGQANPWVSLFSNVLGNGAKAYAMNAGGAGTSGGTPVGNAYSMAAMRASEANPSLSPITFSPNYVTG